MTSYVYLHGFASSPASSKAAFFKAQMASRGVALHIPALDGGDFEHLTLTKQLASIETEVQARPAVLIGSSMGGYLAALYASSRLSVERLVLLAPAFDFRKRWSAMQGPQAIEDWKQTGSLTVMHYGSGRPRSVGYGLYEDAARYPPYPPVAQPTLVLHGRYDETIPAAYSEEFAIRNPRVELEMFDSGHELTDVLPQLWTATERFLFHSG